MQKSMPWIGFFVRSSRRATLELASAWGSKEKALRRRSQRDTESPETGALPFEAVGLSLGAQNRFQLLSVAKSCSLRFRGALVKSGGGQRPTFEEVASFLESIDL